uniref:RidA family protein n=1 Tax=Pararhizobium sp. IMCC3301 TaxID=3067904 RepID=UPI002740671E|nr:Rid family hydrolase [Pararhizobium sp. IMCC3301]
MVNRFVHHTPGTIRAPFANYSHGVELPPGARIIVCSGQLGVTAEDSVPEGSEAQSDLIFSNISEILASADMELSDIVRINAYVSDRDHLAGYMCARDRYVCDPPPASTLMIVSGFARPEFVVEIEVLAARAG